MSRYTVDLRVGCVAVVDTHHPSYPSGNGLHADYDEVIGHWNLSDTLAEWQARRLCDAANALHAQIESLTQPARRLIAMDFGADGWGPLCEAQAASLRKAVGAIDASRAARRSDGA